MSMDLDYKKLAQAKKDDILRDLDVINRNWFFRRLKQHF